MNVARIKKLLEISLLVATAFTLMLLLARSVKSPVGLDEGYNLEVVQNLSQGIGCASFGNHRLDAWWSAKAALFEVFPKGRLVEQTPKPWFFDPRVTTGPTVLMPLGLLFRVFPGNLTAVRIFMWAFLFLFFFVLWWALPEGTRRWPAVALAGSLTVSLWYGFHPGAVLGELPKATLFAAACVVVARSRPFLGGLLFGLAALAKTISLPGSLLVVGVVGVSQFLARKSQKHALVLMVVGLLLPLAAFELYRFFVLGSFASWLGSWQEFLAFSKEQTTPPTPGVWLAKWRSLKVLGPGTFFPLAALAAMAGLISVTLRSRKTATTGEPRPLPSPTPGTLMVIGAVPMALVWVFRSAQTSYRQAVPAALLLFAGLMLWWLSKARPDPLAFPELKLSGVCYLVAAALSVVAVVSWAVRFWSASDFPKRFAEQKMATALLTTSGAQWISSSVRFYEPFPFLSNLRVHPCPGPGQALVVTAWAQVAEGKNRDFYRSRCDAVIFENKDALICWPKVVGFSLQELELADWGPKQVTYAQKPSTRTPKTSAFWFRLQRPVLSRPRLVLLVAGQPSGPVTWAADGTWFSGPLDPTLVSSVGELELTLWDPCAGEFKGVGRLPVVSK